MVLQAAARGYLTRKQLQQQREREEQAAVLIQVGANCGADVDSGNVKQAMTYSRTARTLRMASMHQY